MDWLKPPQRDKLEKLWVKVKTTEGHYLKYLFRVVCYSASYKLYFKLNGLIEDVNILYISEFSAVIVRHKKINLFET